MKQPIVTNKWSWHEPFSWVKEHVHGGEFFGPQPIGTPFWDDRRRRERRRCQQLSTKNPLLLVRHFWQQVNTGVTSDPRLEQLKHINPGGQSLGQCRGDNKFGERPRWFQRQMTKKFFRIGSREAVIYFEAIKLSANVQAPRRRPYESQL